MQELPVPRALFGGAVAVAAHDFMKDRISLADELAELADTLEAAQLIAELLVTNAMPDEESSTRAPKMLEAILSLAIGRVRLLRKAVVGGADFSLLVARHNRVGATGRGDDPDVQLPVSDHVRSRRRR